MAQPSESHAPPQSDDSFFELLVETLENVEESVRAQFLQQFFKSIARIELSPEQSLEYWREVLARRLELAKSIGASVSAKTALIHVLASANIMRVPILMEYADLKKLQLNAATDPLTGLYNRRLFDEYSEKELNRVKRYGQHLALVLLDLRQLKEINDQHGHLQGDQILQLAATILRKNLRASDFAFRIGGDEFALLLPQADPEQAAVLCDRLRAHFEEESAALHLNAETTVDYGIAVHPQDGETKEALLRVADQRLYQLKNAPRADVKRGAAAQIFRPEAPKPQASAFARPAAVPTPSAERRKWERVSLAGTKAYAVISGREKQSIAVVDLCTGGLAFVSEGAEDMPASFLSVLHVPILPPLRVNLRKVYSRKVESGRTRIGCAFVS